MFTKPCDKNVKLLKILEKDCQTKYEAKYEAAKNVISTWVKNKGNIWPLLLEGQNVKRENHRTRVH